MVLSPHEERRATPTGDRGEDAANLDTIGALEVEQSGVGQRREVRRRNPIGSVDELCVREQQSVRQVVGHSEHAGNGTDGRIERSIAGRHLRAGNITS